MARPATCAAPALFVRTCRLHKYTTEYLIQTDPLQRRHQQATRAAFAPFLMTNRPIIRESKLRSFFLLKNVLRVSEYNLVNNEVCNCSCQLQVKYTKKLITVDLRHNQHHPFFAVSEPNYLRIIPWLPRSLPKRDCWADLHSSCVFCISKKHFLNALSWRPLWGDFSTSPFMRWRIVDVMGVADCLGDWSFSPTAFQ